MAACKSLVKPIAEFSTSTASHELITHLLSLSSRCRTVLFTCGWMITEADEQAIGLLPASAWQAAVDQGRRRAGRQARLRDHLPAQPRRLLNDALRGRVMPFDERAARRYTDVITGREHAGRSIGVPDAQIAAICRELGAVLATRNTKDFEEAGVELVDPWQAGTWDPGLARGIVTMGRGRLASGYGDARG